MELLMQALLEFNREYLSRLMTLHTAFKSDFAAGKQFHVKHIAVKAVYFKEFIFYFIQ
jgi:hypothetical protein